MKRLAILLALACSTPTLAAAADPAPAPAAASCAAEGDVSFVCGIRGPEDLVAIPGSPWLITGSLIRGGGGGLHLVDTKTKTETRIYPDGADARPDKLYGACPGAPDPKTLMAHGLSLRTKAPGQYTLYAVNHGGGGRETIEVFAVSTQGKGPKLTWQGCVPLPPQLSANSVAAFSDGGLVATILTMPGQSFGQPGASGAVARWTPGAANFELLKGAELRGNNGIETSPDDREFYVAASGSQKVVAFSRSEPVQVLRETKPLGFFPDNIRLAPDGKLIAAGLSLNDQACVAAAGAEAMQRCPHGYAVAAIDPKDMSVEILARGDAIAETRGVSAAVPVGDTLWLGVIAGDRLPYRTLPAAAAR